MSVGGKISGKQYTGNYGTHSYRKNVGKLYTVKVGIQFTGKSSVDCTPEFPVWTHTGKGALTTRWSGHRNVRAKPWDTPADKRQEYPENQGPRFQLHPSTVTPICSTKSVPPFRSPPILLHRPGQWPFVMPVPGFAGAVAEAAQGGSK